MFLRKLHDPDRLRLMCHGVPGGVADGRTSGIDRVRIHSPRAEMLEYVVGTIEAVVDRLMACDVLAGEQDTSIAKHDVGAGADETHLGWSLRSEWRHEWSREREHGVRYAVADLLPLFLRHEANEN
jgi:hypothetical protein